MNDDRESRDREHEMARSRGTPQEQKSTDGKTSEILKKLLKMLDTKVMGRERVVAGVMRMLDKLPKLANIYIPDSRVVSDEVLTGVMNSLSVGQYRPIVKFHDQAEAAGLSVVTRPELLNAVAVARIFLGQLKEAERLLFGLMEGGGFQSLKPRLRAAILNNLTGLCFEQEQYKEALGYTQRSLQADPTNCPAYINQLEILIKLEGRDAAEEECGSILAAMNKNAPHWLAVDGFLVAMISNESLRELWGTRVFSEFINEALDLREHRSNAAK